MDLRVQHDTEPAGTPIMDPRSLLRVSSPVEVLEFIRVMFL